MTTEIMIQLDGPLEKTNTNQSVVDTVWTLNMCGPVERTNCR